MTDLAAPHAQRWKTGPGLVIGTIVLLVLLVLGFLSVLWTPYPTLNFDVGAALQDANGAHWLGTDPLGRDIVSLLMKGVLTSFVVAGAALLIGAIFGLPLGFAAVRWPRLAGSGVTGLSSLLSLFPALVVALLLTTIFGPSTVVAMLAISIGNVAPLASTLRGAILAYQTRSYLEAARLAGISNWEATRRHVLRPISISVLAQAVGLLSAGMIGEAGLSYLGLGTQSPAASLGVMLHDAQNYMSAKPLLLIFPGLVLTAMITALGLVTRGVRAQARPGEDVGAA